jgi:hypothetical protein
MKAVNAIIFSVIGLLREDPLSPGILDVLFRRYMYHVSLLVSEFIYLTGFLLWRRYRRQYSGDIFLGAFLPQKWDDLPPF